MKPSNCSKIHYFSKLKKIPAIISCNLHVESKVSVCYIKITASLGHNKIIFWHMDGIVLPHLMQMFNKTDFIEMNTLYCYLLYNTSNYFRGISQFEVNGDKNLFFIEDKNKEIYYLYDSFIKKYNKIGEIVNPF